MHININYYERTYNVGDVLNCIKGTGEVNYTKKEKYDNNVVVDKVIDGSEIFIHGKIVDDFNILDQNYVMYVCLMYQLPRNFKKKIIKQKN